METTTRGVTVWFQPILTVGLDGPISIDWSDSQIGATDADGEDVEIPENERGESLAAEHLDAILGEGSRLGATPAQQAQALRRLADAIEQGCTS